MNPARNRERGKERNSSIGGCINYPSDGLPNGVCKCALEKRNRGEKYVRMNNSDIIDWYFLPSYILDIPAIIQPFCIIILWYCTVLYLGVQIL